MKIVAIDHLLYGVTFETIKPHLPAELKTAWELYKKGIIREFYNKQDKPGVVIIMECKDVDSARKILNELPLVKEKYIAFDFYPISAFTGWEAIFKDSE